MNLPKKTSLLLILFLIVIVTQLNAQEYNHQITNEYNGLIPNEYKLETIVIDAGHGSYDHGAVGLNSIEKELTLQIALKLEQLIKQKWPNVNVIQTRRNDSFLSLQERADKANTNSASLFISLHCNASEKTKNGIEIYTLGTHRSADNLEVAIRENGSILIESPNNTSYQHFDPVATQSYSYGFFQPGKFHNHSIAFANQIDKNIRQIGRHSKGVQQAEFLVLKIARTPAVLVELGYLTNNSDEQYLKSTNGKSELSSALFNAIIDYKSELDIKAKQILDSKKEEIRKIEERKKQEEQARKQAELERKRKLEENWAWPSLRKLDMSGVKYLVQIKISKQYDEKDFPFKNIVINRIDVIDSYKYLVGPYTSKEEADKIHKQAQEAGLRNAFVLKYVNGKIER